MTATDKRSDLLVARADWTRPEEYPEPGDLTDVLWAWEFLRRNSSYQEAWEAGDEARSRGWGLAELVDPAISKPSRLRFLKSYGSMIIGEWSSYLEVPAGYVYYCFDITKALPEQIEKAESDLRIVQEMEPKIGAVPPVRFKRRRIDKWPLYLRFLDAEAKNVSRRSMATALFPDLEDEYPVNAASKLVSEQLQRAYGLVTGGYLGIVPVDPIRK